MKSLLIILFNIILISGAYCQETVKNRYAIKFNSVSLVQAFDQVENISGLTFAYNKKYLPIDYKVFFSTNSLPLSQIMDSILYGTNLGYRIGQQQVLIFQRKKLTINGTVEDRNSGERLISANIYDPATFRGVITNNYGLFSITLPRGLVRLRCSYVGFKHQDINLNLLKDTVLNIKLVPLTSIEEITIIGELFPSIIKNTQMSMNQLSAKTIKRIPVLFGEKDILKTLQLLPGIQSGNEGTSGIYVRGGGPDQNLILLDGVPVYNVNHMFGFFSIFNPEAVQNVKIIKGGFPARYGGRLSSILDIRLKEGNNKKFAAEGSVGLISSKLTLEGPIIKDKTSFILSGRRTYIDVLSRPAILMITAQGAASGSFGGFNFYDFTAKLNHRFSDRSRVFISSYFGKDNFYLNVKDQGRTSSNKVDFGLGWGNATTVLRWNYILNSKLFCNTSLTFSNYQLVTDLEIVEKEQDKMVMESGFTYDSGIRDLTASVDFDFAPSPDHSVKFGLNNTLHNFHPGVSIYKMVDDPDAEPVEQSFGGEDIKANELRLYAEDDWQVGPRFKLNFGLHGSSFLVDSSAYFSLQPRLSGLFVISDQWSIKAAYSHMDQNIHLLSNSAIGFPTDLWLPVTALIKPQKSVQYAIGSTMEFPKGWTLSLEGYFKSMDNLITYKEGSSYFTIQQGDWQEKLAFGIGKSYGVEFLVRKTRGNTTGWIGYTLSKSSRKFPEISFGEWFPYTYDRRHDISIVLNHRFNDNIDLGLTWVYGTGNSLTLPYESYLLEFWPGNNSSQVDHFESRNSFRMSAYHRLDFGINFHKEKKWGTRTWSFGLYNVYNRKNPFFINTLDRSVGSNSNQIAVTQFSFFPIIPSVSYSFKLR